MISRRPIQLALIALLLVAGCVEDARPAPGVDRFPTGPATLGATTTPLVRQSLQTQADFDSLEDGVLRRMGLGELIAVYTKLAERIEPATDESAALLLQRLAMLHLRLGSREGGFQRAFAVAERLRREAPASPHTEFLMGAITSLLMPPSADGTYRIAPRRLDVAIRLSEHWQRLLKRAPEYLGPTGRDAKRIVADLALLQVAIDETSRSVTPEIADADQQADGISDEAEAGPMASAQPRVTAAAPVHSEDATADEAAAQQDLHRLDQGDTMARRLLCRDRRERRLQASDVRRDVVRWVELRCAVDLDEADDALTWLGALVESGAITSACRWLDTITGGTEAARQVVHGAMVQRGLPGCSGP